ncbi:hypothetical protein HDU93_003255 [Gonapodya sp. JEL0774]|nr:hypothetical protein HDU93_003255 [Gonapodya sp. JEL0774]
MPPSLSYPDSSYGSPGDVFTAEDGSMDHFAHLLAASGSGSDSADLLFNSQLDRSTRTEREPDEHDGSLHYQQHFQMKQEESATQAEFMIPDSGIICDPAEEDRMQEVNFTPKTSSLTPSLDLRRLNISNDTYFTPLTSPALNPHVDTAWVPTLNPALPSNMLRMIPSSGTLASTFDASVDPESIASLQRIQERRSHQQQLLAQLQEENERLQREELAIIQRLGQKQAEQLSNGEQLLQQLAASNQFAMSQPLESSLTVTNAGLPPSSITMADVSNLVMLDGGFSSQMDNGFSKSLNNYGTLTSERGIMDGINPMSLQGRSPRIRPVNRSRLSSMSSPPNPYPTSQPTTPQLPASSTANVIPAKRKSTSNGSVFAQSVAGGGATRTSSRKSLQRTAAEGSTRNGSGSPRFSPRDPQRNSTSALLSPTALVFPDPVMGHDQTTDPRAIIGDQIDRRGSPFKVPMTPATILHHQDFGGQPAISQQAHLNQSPRLQAQSRSQLLSAVPPLQQPQPILHSGSPRLVASLNTALPRTLSPGQFQNSPHLQPFIVASPRLHPTITGPVEPAGQLTWVPTSNFQISPQSGDTMLGSTFLGDLQVNPVTPSTLMNLSQAMMDHTGASDQFTPLNMTSSGNTYDHHTASPQAFLFSDANLDNLGGEVGGGGDFRKVTHKVAEQRRRDSLRNCFERLKDTLPPESLAGEKNPSKVYILRKAFDYITHLRTRELDSREIISLLEAELADLENGGEGGGAYPESRRRMDEAKRRDWERQTQRQLDDDGQRDHQGDDWEGNEDDDDDEMEEKKGVRKTKSPVSRVSAKGTGKRK